MPRILTHDPVVLEGVDHYLIHDEQIEGMNTEALDQPPTGTGYLPAAACRS